MKRLYLLVTLLLISSFSLFAQKKEKIKGSKFVTVSQVEVDKFDTLEILDDLEIFLILGDKPQIEIEADDNLHEILEKQLSGNKLILSTNKQASGAKKFVIRLTYTKNLKLIEVKNDAQLNALQELQVDNISIKNYDYSKSFLNVNTQTFTLILADKSRAELNLKADQATLELNRNANLKALVTTSNLKADLYSKATAVIEGDVNKGKIRMDGDSNFTGKNLTFVSLDVSTESFAKAAINVQDALTISAIGKSQLEIYGAPNYTIKKFADKATLYKK